MRRVDLALLLALCVWTGPGVASAQEALPVVPTEPQQPAVDKKHQADIDADIALGKKYADQVLKQEKVSKNKEYIDRVNRVGITLAQIAQTHQVAATWGDKRLNAFPYVFTVLEGEDVNAFSLPGGYIFVYEGFMKYIESDDELAGVLAHEISHASFRHMATLQKEAQRLQTVSLPLLLLALFSGGQAGGDVLTLQQLVSIAMGSGWSLKAEQSADYGGFQYMLFSKYNPVGLLTFMERLERDERSNPARAVDWGIYRTHPPSRERAEALTQELNEHQIPIRRSAVTETFRCQVVPAEGAGVDVLFGGRKLHTFGGDSALQRADTAAEALNAFFDQVPELFEVRALPDGVIEGQGHFLFRVTAEDAAIAGLTTTELADRIEGSIKRSLYMLAYRVWDGR